MPRRVAKAKTDENTENTEGTEETKPTRRRRAGTKKTVTKKAAPRRRGKAAEEDNDNGEESKPTRRRRGGKAKAKAADKAEPKKAARTRAEPIYSENHKDVWDELDDGKETRIGINGDAVNPRGVVQEELVDFVKGRGRKKVTAQNAIDYLQEEVGKSVGYATYTVATCLNTGVITAL